MNTHIKIGNKKIGPGERPYIIAEMACAHDGDIQKATKLVDAAVDAGADAIQLQFFELDETLTPSHEAYSVVKGIVFSPQQWSEIFNYSRSKGIDVFVCTYDVPSVKLAVKLGADGIKLNSSDLSNPEVVIEVATSGIAFTLGTGASTLDEIKKGLELAMNHGALNVVLMHGVQNFPTKRTDLNILRIKWLQENFPIPVGYHDHTDADDPFAKIVDLVAVGMGANVIEKHITLDRKEKGLDYQAALEPEEFRAFVENIRQAHIALGKKELDVFSESDLRYRKFQKKSIVAGRMIRSGEIISRDMVKFIRNTEPGIPPSEFKGLVGKQALCDIPLFQNITFDMVK
ncbi:MAG TPA: N-acetylneuraminate synthase family protein [Bacteroidia bacterium]|jgi:sialic acid synthase SpsE